MDMTPSIKLTYFDIKGLGEPIRLLLKYGKIEFQDIRISKENWPNLKPDTPFGQLPIYQENDKAIWQSHAICRYVAKKVKLTGENDWEDLEIDAIVDTIRDLTQKVGEYRRETDLDRKEKLKGPLFNETVPYYMEKLDEFAKKNNGFLCLNRLTWADIYYYSLSNRLIESYPEIYETYTNLINVVENVRDVLQVEA